MPPLQLVDQEQHDPDGGVLGDVLFIQSATDPLAVVEVIRQVCPADLASLRSPNGSWRRADPIDCNRSFPNPRSEAHRVHTQSKNDLGPKLLEKPSPGSLAICPTIPRWTI